MSRAVCCLSAVFARVRNLLRASSHPFCNVPTMSLCRSDATAESPLSSRVPRPFRDATLYRLTISLLTCAIILHFIVSCITFMLSRNQNYSWLHVPSTYVYVCCSEHIRWRRLDKETRMLRDSTSLWAKFRRVGARHGDVFVCVCLCVWWNKFAIIKW